MWSAPCAWTQRPNRPSTVKIAPRLRRDGHLLFRGLRPQIIRERLIVDVKLLKRGIAIAHPHGHVSVLFSAPAVFPIHFLRFRRAFFRHPESVERNSDMLFLIPISTGIDLNHIVTANGCRADAVDLGKSI